MSRLRKTLGLAIAIALLLPQAQAAAEIVVFDIRPAVGGSNAIRNKTITRIFKNHIARLAADQGYVLLDRRNCPPGTDVHKYLRVDFGGEIGGFFSMVWVSTTKKPLFWSQISNPLAPVMDLPADSVPAEIRDAASKIWNEVTHQPPSVDANIDTSEPTHILIACFWPRNGSGVHRDVFNAVGQGRNSLDDWLRDLWKKHDWGDGTEYEFRGLTQPEIGEICDDRSRFSSVLDSKYGYDVLLTAEVYGDDNGIVIVPEVDGDTKEMISVVPYNDTEFRKELTHSVSEYWK